MNLSDSRDGSLIGAYFENPKDAGLHAVIADNLEESGRLITLKFVDRAWTKRPSSKNPPLDGAKKFKFGDEFWISHDGVEYRLLFSAGERSAFVREGDKEIFLITTS